MKIILVYESIDNLSEALSAKMVSSGYELVPFTQLDEIHQLGNHLGKVVILFTESRKAAKFLSSSINLDNAFQTMNILYVSKTPVINVDTQNKLDQLKLKLYFPKLEDKLFKDLTDFYNNNSHQDDELEFITDTD